MNREDKNEAKYLAADEVDEIRPTPALTEGVFDSSEFAARLGLTFCIHSAH